MQRHPARPPRLRIRKTPYGLHLYTARVTGDPIYGWGNTPAAARAKYHEQKARQSLEEPPLCTP